MNKLFIAGASGNIGKELISFLSKKKEYELHCAYYKSKISKKKNISIMILNLKFYMYQSKYLLSSG